MKIKSMNAKSRQTNLKITSFLMAILMVLCLFPVTAVAATPQYTISKSKMEENIQKLSNLATNGYYFTTSGRSDSNYVSSAVTSVITKNWLKNNLGKVPFSQSILPSGPMLVDEKDYYGYQCFGFAVFASWYIFSPNEKGDMYCTVSERMDFTYSNVTKYAKRGDQLRIGNGSSPDDHSVIFLEANADKKTIKVLDCNWDCGGTSKIKVHNITCNSGIYTKMRIGHISNVTIVDDISTKVTGISVSPTSANLTVGDTKSLTATVSPSNATNKSVTWSSTNTNVATVSSSGVVTAKAKGTATIKATTSDGGYTASCTVTVNPITYTVTYDANGGSEAPASQTKEKGVGLTLSSSVPERSGYTFKGWEYKGIEESNEWVATKPANGNYVIGYKYYIYGYECDHCRDYGYNYDVDFTFYCGDVKSEVIDDVKGATSVYGAYTPSKLRYFYRIENTDKGKSFYPGQSGSSYNYFNADYIAEDGKTGTASIYKTPFYFESVVYRQTATAGKIYQPGEIYDIDTDMELTAVWEKDAVKYYTINYDANEGTGAPAPQTKTEKESIALSSIKPYRSGYTFLGWSTSQTAVSAEYVSGEVFVTDANITLYAVWEKDPAKYTINYDANGGDGAPASQIKTENVNLILSNTVPTRSDYNFAGWATVPTATTASYTAGSVFEINATTTLYAIWKKNVQLDSVTISVSDIEGKPGETIEVPFVIENNPGFASFDFEIGYDSEKFELLEITPKEALSSAMCAPNKDEALISVMAMNDIVDNGTLFVAKFEIDTNIEDGMYNIFVNGNVYNENGEMLPIVTLNGSVTISSSLPGDVNCDGIVNSLDAMLILRYSAKLIGSDGIKDIRAADFNGDNMVNSLDAMLTLRRSAHLI